MLKNFERPLLAVAAQNQSGGSVRVFRQALHGIRGLLLFAAISLLAQDPEELVARHAASAAEALRTGDYASAESHNRAILRLRPELAEARVNLGLSLFLQKRYEEAIGAFEAGLKSKPELANAWLFLGISRFNLNRPSDAVAALKTYTSAHPDDLQGQYFLGLAELARERYASAAQALTAARAIDPRNMDVLYHLAQAWLGEARVDPAKRDSMWPLYQRTVQEIAAVDPGSFRIAQLRAGYYQANGEKAAAVRELESLLQHDPKVRGLHYTLGCLYTERSQFAQALEQFRAEMLLDAPYPRTHLQMGHVYLELGKASEALPHLREAMRIEPESRGLAWVELGRAYRDLKRAGEAVAAFEQAIQLGRGSASVYYQLAMAARSAGKIERSREALAISQRLRGDDQQNKAPAR